MPSINWTAYFNSRHDNDTGNKNTTVYTEAWAQNNNHNTKVGFITNDADTVVLAANMNDTILFLHSFKNIGGTPLLPANKYACIIGANENASAVIMDMQSITSNANLRTPKIANIVACGTVEAIADLPAPPNNAAVTYPGCSSFLPAPWLVDAILAAGTNKPFELILAAKAAAAAFDTAHDANTLYTTKAADHLEDFILWAWGVAKNKVTRASYIFDPDDAELARYRAARIQQCILPPLPQAPILMPNLPPPPQGQQAPAGAPPNFGFPPIANGNGNNPNDAILLQLANSIIRQTEEAATHNELFTRQLDYTVERDDKKKDRFKKLHPSVKQLLLFASAEDADTVPDDVLDSCKRFINAETEGIADQELNIQFKNLNLHDAAFSIGFTQALYGGKFTWSDQSTPSNFSPFCIFEVEPLLAAEQQNRHFVLHIIQTQGKGRTIDEIKSSSKQEVKAPTSYQEMIQQLHYFAGACEIFFGEFSVATASIKALIGSVDKYKHIFKARESREIEFVSKFFYAVDTRMQTWLEECMTLTSRDQVDDSTLNFSSLVESVRFGNFDMKLPPTFCKVDPESNDKKRASKSGNDKADNENKSNKRAKGKQALTNSSPPEDCKLKTGETWAANFANKLDGRVKWDDTCFMCARWLIVGRCFSNCNNAKSHVAAADIPDDKLTAFKEYMRKCRST